MINATPEEFKYLKLKRFGYIWQFFKKNAFRREISLVIIAKILALFCLWFFFFSGGHHDIQKMKLFQTIHKKT